MAESRFKKYREQLDRSEKQVKPVPEKSAAPLGTFVILTLLVLLTGVWGYYYIAKAPSNIAKKFADTQLLKITFFDVGQGDSAFIMTPSGATILIDAGGRPGYPAEENEEAQIEKNDYASGVIIPYLKKELKFSATAHTPVFIDYYVATHPHPDHYGGFVTLIENNILPKKLYLCGSLKTYQLYTDFLAKMRNEKLPAVNVPTGKIIDFGDGVSAKFLGPLVRYSGTTSDDNNSSVVMKIYYKNVSVLFTGDIELAAENDLGNWRGVLKSTVLKVANHGSRTSTSSPFLDKASPLYTVISAGYDNTFGYPHEVTIKKLTDRNIKIYRTDRNGSITLITDGKLLKIDTER